MSEPVVITGLAAKPAKRRVAQVQNDAQATAGDTDLPPEDLPENGKGKASTLLLALAHRGREFFGLMARGVLAVAKLGMAVGRRYPRHSLAAVASILILGSIWYTQGSRAPVTTKIAAQNVTEGAKDAKPAAGPKTDGAAAAPGQPATASGEKPAGPNPGETATARSDAPPPTDKPSPAPAANDVLPALADAPPAGKEPEPAPTPASPPGQSTPTLLGSALPDPAPPPLSAVVKNDKDRVEATQPAPATGAPALAADLPAPGIDSTQLATKLEPAVDPNKSAPPAASKPPSPEPANGTSQPAAPGETTTPEKKPQDALPFDPEPPPSSPPSPKVEEPTPGAPGLAPKPEVIAMPSSPPELPAPGGGTAGTTKPPVEGSATGIELPAAGAPPDSKSPTPEAKSPIPEAKEIESRAPDASRQTPAPEPHSSAVKQDEPAAGTRTSQDLASDGWVSVPNSGKVPTDDVTDADAREGAATSVGTDGSPLARDERAHAAKNVTFELESPRTRATPDVEQNGQPAAAGLGAVVDPKSRSADGRVDSVPHVVERGENFWTISRLYYSNGRYYKALWKANSDKYTKMTSLKVNDVIMVPSVEDLDPAFIDPPRTRASASLAAAATAGGRSRAGSLDTTADLTESSASTAAAATRDGSYSNARTNRRSGGGVPVQRSSRTDPDLDLPPPDTVVRRGAAPDRTGRRVDRPLGDDDTENDEPETRTAARPRAAAASSQRHPVYKIRPYDTLRSIARDMLGDSHRANEILDMNADLIDDPTHLITGQLIQLPDDARTGVRRTANR